MRPANDLELRTPRSPRASRLVLMGGLALAWTGAVVGARAALLPPGPTTWTVSKTGGSDFDEIQPALDVAVDGDLILVGPGSYGSFTLTENLTLVGEPGVQVVQAVVSGVTVKASLAELAFQGCTVTGCTGTVVLDGLLGNTAPVSSVTPPSLTIQGSSDVRVIDLGRAAFSLWPWVTIDASHAELVTSTVVGRHGADNGQAFEEAGDGGPAIRVINGGRAYVARSQPQGGEGGQHQNLLEGYGGDGGPAVEVVDSDVLVLGRGKELLQGGRGGGCWSLYGYAGDGGDGAVVTGPGSRLRHSNVVLDGGAGGGGSGVPGDPGQDLVVNGGKAASPSLPDPSLERTAVPVAGGTAALKLRSSPGAFSRLFVGTVPLVKPTAGVFVDKLVEPEATYGLGLVPSSGVLSASIPLDPAWGPGTTVYAQAMSIYPGGKIRRTNSVPFVLR